MPRTDYTRAVASASSTTTASFTPPNNSTLVVAAMFMDDGNISTDPVNATITDSAGLTWTRRVYVGLGASLFFFTNIVVWTAPVTTGVSMTVTVNSNEASCQRIVIAPYAYTDVASIGGTASGTLNGPVTDGSYSITLSAAPDANSEVIAFTSVTNANSGQVRVDPGSGWTEIFDIGEDGMYCFQAQFREDNTSTTVTWADVLAAASTDTRWTSSSSDSGAAVALVINLSEGAPAAPKLGRCIYVMP